MDVREAIRNALPAMQVIADLGPVAGAEREVLVGCATRANPGLEARLAWEIADFLPLACGRATLQGKGLRFDEHYVRIDSAGRARVYRKLLDEPVYREAMALLPEIAALEPSPVAQSANDPSARAELDLSEGEWERMGEGMIGKLARFSAEFQAIHYALNASSRPEDLDLSPPILNGPDELCDPLEQAPRFEEPPWWWDTWKPAKKPWWKFW